MATNLLTPILNNRTRAVNFFNGRLLTGEDLTAEQQANRSAHSLLGQDIGAGVSYGLEVSESPLSSTVQAPVVAVAPGLAINRNGGLLLLDNGGGNTEISLVRPPTATNASTAIFQDCAPVQTGAYVAGAGVYLLTIGPANAKQGLAEASGINTATAPCNSNFNAYGVQFRLVQLDLSLVELADAKHLRNLVAYKFFAPADWASLVANPFGPNPTGFGLLDQLRAAQLITDCEVPLATLYWTATDGLVYVDMWSVRRVLTPFENGWPSLASQRRVNEAEAMFFQFEGQVQSILASAINPATVAATDNFQFLPPAGVVPIKGDGSPNGFNTSAFFVAHASKDIATTDADQLRRMFHEALYHEPVELARTGKIQLYLIWENLQAIRQGSSSQLAMVFAGPELPYRGIARFGFGKFALSRFAPSVI